MTCLKDQPPVVTIKRPVVEYAMLVIKHFDVILDIYTSFSGGVIATGDFRYSARSPSPP